LSARKTTLIETIEVLAGEQLCATDYTEGKRMITDQATFDVLLVLFVG